MAQMRIGGVNWPGRFPKVPGKQANVNAEPAYIIASQPFWGNSFLNVLAFAGFSWSHFASGMVTLIVHFIMESVSNCVSAQNGIFCRLADQIVCQDEFKMLFVECVCTVYDYVYRTVDLTKCGSRLHTGRTCIPSNVWPHVGTLANV